METERTKDNFIQSMNELVRGYNGYNMLYIVQTLSMLGFAILYAVDVMNGKFEITNILYVIMFAMMASLSSLNINIYIKALYQINVDMDNSDLSLNDEDYKEISLTPKTFQKTIDEEEVHRINFIMRFFGLEGLESEVIEREIEGGSLTFYNKPVTIKALNRYVSSHDSIMRKEKLKLKVNGVLSVISLVLAGALSTLGLDYVQTNYHGTLWINVVAIMSLGLLALFIHRGIIYYSTLKTSKALIYNCETIENYLVDNGWRVTNGN